MFCPAIRMGEERILFDDFRRFVGHGRKALA
jgi:hypothetical protein